MLTAPLSPRKLQLAALLLGALGLTAAFALFSGTENPALVLTAVAAGDQRYEMFLKLDTIPGDSTDQKHKAEIAVDSFAWGETRGMGAGKPSMDGLVVTLPANKASPKLFLYTAGGLKISRVVLSVRSAGAGSDMLRWILTDAQIVSYKTVGNTHGDGVMDQITLVPGKIEVELLPSDGSAPMKAGWDQRTGKSVGY
jgi:type VI secretion system secreted protein Hcp